MKPTIRKVAVVTGAGKRLGRHIALALGENGFDLVVNYLSSQKGAQATVKLIREKGQKAIAVKADISKKAEVRRLFEKTIDRFGRVDLLVNNSAVFIESPLGKTTERIWDKTLDTNLKGTFLCCQAAAPYFLAQKAGRIINIASLGGIQAWKEHLPYSVSKAGVIMLTRCLAKALAPGVLVNAIAPGAILFDKEEVERKSFFSVDKIPLRKHADPSDITDLVVFLATNAKHITGQTFVIDGGRSIQQS